MSIQWTLVAGVMYAELAATIILLLPFISPQRWNSFFKSNFLRSISNMGTFYFRIFLGVLVLFFLDAIREMYKYSAELKDQQHSDHGVHLDAGMQSHMRLFRAQRNFYISGFALILWVVLQRLTTLISRLAVSMAEKEAALKQAQSASLAAKTLMKAQETKGKGKGKGKDEDETDETEQEGVNLANEMKEIKEKNHKLEAEFHAALKQASSVTEEYDRLLEEHSKVQEELRKLKNEEGSKKAD